MGDPRVDISRRLLETELRRIVADAKRSSGTVHPKAHALTLLMAFPGAQYSLERIVEEMVKIAITYAGWFTFDPKWEDRQARTVSDATESGRNVAQGSV